MNSKRLVGYWLLSACVLIMAMVILGGITRLTHSGLSMVDWKPIRGIIPPIDHEQWVIEFDNYKQFPEFQKINKGMTLSDFKMIFFWEYLHRLIGRFIGLYFIFPFLYFYKKKFLPNGIIKNLLVMFLLGGFQGFMGWYMVKSGLVDNPFVSHYRLAAHLIIAFILIAYIFWTYLVYFAKKDDNPKLLNRSKLQIVHSLPYLVLLQIIWGAFTAGLKAGLSWNTFPLMNGQLIPTGLFGLSPWWLSMFEHHMTIQFIHRLLGVVIFIIILIIWFRYRSIEISKLQHLATASLVIIVTIQFLLGLFTLLTHVNISLAVIHQAGAGLLLLSSIYTVFRFKSN
ncbi:MAG: COX15/CtaA family protein [Candidatus Marinimicrobia bacterium]|nr:COX15/CtaA family protein [Candidatus Neomarinimicrobiota bacterium]